MAHVRVYVLTRKSLSIRFREVVDEMSLVESRCRHLRDLVPRPALAEFPQRPLDGGALDPRVDRLGEVVEHLRDEVLVAPEEGCRVQRVAATKGAGFLQRRENEAIYGYEPLFHAHHALTRPLRLCAIFPFVRSLLNGLRFLARGHRNFDVSTSAAGSNVDCRKWHALSDDSVLAPKLRRCLLPHESYKDWMERRVDCQKSCICSSLDIPTEPIRYVMTSPYRRSDDDPPLLSTLCTELLLDNQIPVWTYVDMVTALIRL